MHALAPSSGLAEEAVDGLGLVETDGPAHTVCSAHTEQPLDSQPSGQEELFFWEPHVLLRRIMTKRLQI